MADSTVTGASGTEPAMAGTGRAGPLRRVAVHVLDASGVRLREDEVITEEPLQVRVDPGAGAVSVAVTMRTPGHDFELAVGFLYGEGLLSGCGDVRAVRYCADAAVEQRYNVVTVELSRQSRLRPEELADARRATVTSSACGVCGVSSLEQVRARLPQPLRSAVEVSAEVLAGLPELLRQQQRLFDHTGGLHAAGLFTRDGEPLLVREDVGRHNAVDKVVGALLLADRLPGSDQILVVSGRAGFEIVQKAAAAGIPLVASVSAPTSLAVDLARDRGLTLVGFVREGRMTVYAGSQRVRT